MKEIRSISFDTSFLLKDDPDVDRVIKKIRRDNIPCYVTSTVVSELEQLKIWGRIDDHTYNKAMSRWKRVNSEIIDFRNIFLSSEIGKKCVVSMKEHHGVDPEDIINDCNILVASLKNGVDLFLSEDFHFTSKITDEVLEEITHSACAEYRMMCDEEMYSVDTKTFLKAYDNGIIDLNVIDFSRQEVRKPGKRIGKK